LDIGCGVGDTTKLLTFFNNVVQVVAIDKAADVIAVADCFNDDLRIRYELADVEDFATLPKSSEQSFHLVTAFRSLQKVQDHESTIRNVAKALTSGGYFLCTLPARPSQRDLDLDEFLYQSKRWRLCRPKKSNISQQPLAWLNERNPASWYEDLLTRNGFQIERCELLIEEIAIGDEEALEYLKMSRLRHLNVAESEYEELVEQAYQAYSKSCRQLGGGYVNWSFETIDVVARKI
jgi:trans-aconitate methyltransferase